MNSEQHWESIPDPSILRIEPGKQTQVIFFTDQTVREYVHWYICPTCEGTMLMPCGIEHCPACKDEVPIQEVQLLPVFNKDEDTIQILVLPSPISSNDYGETFSQAVLRNCRQITNRENLFTHEIRFYYTDFGGVWELGQKYPLSISENAKKTIECFMNKPPELRRFWMSDLLFDYFHHKKAHKASSNNNQVNLNSNNECSTGVENGKQ